MYSDLKHLGDIRFPEARGTRAMMLPFLLDDASSIPMREWRDPVRRMVDLGGGGSGVGYLTIDEAEVGAGETHRRPGLHIDGGGGWGGPVKYASQFGGMLVAASEVGCRAWRQNFSDDAGRDGDCSALAGETREDREIVMRAGGLYWCAAQAVHECIPLGATTRRQFVRISRPSDAPWFEGYTRNPEGIEPTGVILPKRVQQMGFRSESP